MSSEVVVGKEPDAKHPTCIDLFCGCGGFSLGFIKTGWRVVSGVDFHPAALCNYYSNLATGSAAWIEERGQRSSGSGDTWVGSSNEWHARRVYEIPDTANRELNSNGQRKLVTPLDS